MLQRAFLFSLLWWGAKQVGAQEVTTTYSFAEGLYFSYDEFAQNNPGIPLEAVQAGLVTNPRTWITQVEFLTEKKSGSPIAIEELWGICIDGVPYIRIPADSIDKSLPAFAGLRITGRLCYFRYETAVPRRIEMAAYNPLTGKPFRKGEVIREVDVLREYILRFEDGAIGPFTRRQLIEWTSRDHIIQTTLRRLSPDAVNLEDQLYNVILSFNQRHPVFIKP